MARKPDSRKPAIVIRFHSRSEEETSLLGKGLAGILTPPAILLVKGELGMGKTVLIKGLGEGLGIARNLLRSPAFLTALLYPGPVPLLHLDLYRKNIVEPEQVEEVLSFEGIVAVEWGERMEQDLKERGIPVLLIQIRKGKREEERRISLRGKAQILRKIRQLQKKMRGETKGKRE